MPDEVQVLNICLRLLSIIAIVTIIAIILGLGLVSILV